VTEMDIMFSNALAFNQNISGWNVGLVTHYANFVSTQSALILEYTPLKFRPIVS
jgi:hypothetical protein